MTIEVAQAMREQRVTRLRGLLAGLPLANRPTTLEVGCGHGHFLTAYASAHPEEFCLGIDLLADRLARAERKRERANVTNLTWVQAEADDLMAAWPADVRITSRVFVLFPDPWPKRRHWKNRLIQPPFLAALARICAQGVQLCFRTDHPPYFQAAAEVLTAHPDWAVEDPSSWPFDVPTVFQSRAAAYQSAVARRR